MTYPDGFASRLLRYLVTAADPSGIKRFDLDEGWIEYADPYNDTTPGGGRITITDDDISPMWEHVLAEGRSFYPEEPEELAAMIILAVGIQELQDTDDRSVPREFAIREVVSNYARDQLS